MRTALAILIATLLLPRGVHSQVDQAPAQSAPSANLTGLIIGLDPIVYSSLTSDYITGGQARGGGGIALRFGWGFRPKIALIMDVPVTLIPLGDSSEYFLSHGDVLLQFAFPERRLARSVLVPFAQLGLGFREVSSSIYTPAGTLVYSIEGEVFTAGAGLLWFVRRNFAIAGSASYSTGDFNDERLGSTTVHNRGVPGRSWRVQMGVEWRKGRKKTCDC